MFSQPFYFLRHGETELNARRIVAGSIETDLTEAGKAQALRAAELLAAEPITAVYSSPLRRARDTAIPVAQRLGLPVAFIADIAERNWGSLEGQPRGSRMRGVTPAGAETVDDFTARVLRGLSQIAAETPLVVGHSGIFRVLCRTLAIVESESPVGNALPLRFEPLPGNTWKLTPLPEEKDPLS